VRICWPLTFGGPIERCAAALAPLFISFQIKSCTTLCWLTDDRNPHFEEIVSNFEIINKRIFSVAGWMFKPDRCLLTVKDLKPRCLSTVTKILNIDHFCLINIQSVCCSGVTDERDESRFDSPGQLNVKTRPLLSLYFGLVFFWLSEGCLFAFFGNFSLIWGFSIAIHTRIHHYFSSFFSECSLAGHLHRTVGLFQLSVVNVWLHCPCHVGAPALLQSLIVLLCSSRGCCVVLAVS